MEDPIDASQALTGPHHPGPESDSHDLSLDATSAAIVHIPDELSENSHDETGSLYGHVHGVSMSGPGYFYNDHGYNSSASSTEHSSASGVLEHYFEEDDESSHARNSRTSSHSSVSSIPASVLVHPQHHPTRKSKSLTPRRRQQQYIESDGYWAKSNSMSTRRGPFRKPSSVRAIQMHTEDESESQQSDGYSTPSRRRHHYNHRRGGSTRSAGSSPLKKSQSESQSQSHSKPDTVNEYPLVLLHCTLLPPSLPVVGGTFAHRPNQKIVKEVLPKKYYRRWKLLEEKVGSGYLRDRGVLISHPEDSYDLLEEKLLESLELQRPRLHHGHFLAQENDEHESADEAKDDQSDDEDDAPDGDLCPDCGGRVVTCTTQNRKWEVKVFAANGLMRAGAWAAAWREMEKVDVEVSLWLPTDVRRELERRLLEDESTGGETVAKDASLKSQAQSQSQSQNQDVVDGLAEAVSSPKATKSPVQGTNSSPVQEPKPAEIDLQTLLINYVRVLASDKRNIVIALLSITIAVFAMGIGSARQQPGVSDVQVQAQVPPVSVPEIDVSGSSAASMSQYAAASARPSPDPVDVFESAPVANSVPASDADVASADEQETASPELEESNSDVSEVSDSLDESVGADDLPTELPDAPVATEAVAENAEDTEPEPLEPLEPETPVDSPVEPESESLEPAADPALEEPTEESSDVNETTEPEEATQPEIEEPEAMEPETMEPETMEPEATE